MMKLTQGRVTLAFLGAAIVASLAFAPDSMAARRHVSLKKSFPAAKETLTVAPATLQLWFSEKIEMKTSGVKLTGPAGLVTTAPIAGQDSAGAPVTAAILGDTPPGAYKIDWTAGSKDGHPARGAIEFVIKKSH